ncbi:MAG: xylulokinase [Acidimicrobiales bacterium]
MSRRLVVGVDSSTQSTKVEARDLDTGMLVATGSSAHPPCSPPTSEQDPRAWWSALVEAMDQLGDHRSDVVGLSVAGQQHGLVLLGADGEPLRPAKLWNDTTSAPQSARLVEAIGANEWAALTGSVPVAAFTITKLAWVAEHEPETLSKAATVLLPHEYLNRRLTGASATDRGDASGTGWFDPSSGETHVRLLELAAGPGDWLARLPTVVGPTTAIGTLVPDAAAALGLSPAVLVGPGTGDNMAAALGLGMQPGDVAISLGTSGTAFAVSTTATHDPSGLVAGFADADGGFLPLVCTLNATKVTDTVARWVGRDASTFADMALGAASDPGSVWFVPYFDGERTPNLPDASGAIHGLTNGTTAAQIALAAHDGVLVGLIRGIGHLSAAGATVHGRRYLVGGGARSVAYRQRAADLLDQAVIIADTDEAVRTGAAAQAGSVMTGEPLADVTSRWGLGAGLTVDPRHDASAVLDRYQGAAVTADIRPSDG